MSNSTRIVRSVNRRQECQRDRSLVYIDLIIVNDSGIFFGVLAKRINENDITVLIQIDELSFDHIILI